MPDIDLIERRYAEHFVFDGTGLKCTEHDAYDCECARSAFAVIQARLYPYNALLDNPLVQLDATVSAMASDERHHFSRMLDAVAERAARIRGYLDMRGVLGSDRGHAAGVKASNTLATKIRKALGYTALRVTF